MVTVKIMSRKKHPKNWIKEIRKQKGITVREIAEAIGKSSAAVTYLENSESGLSYDVLSQIANFLGVHPSEITDGPGFMMVAKDEFEREVLEELRGLDDSAKQMFLYGLKASKAAADKDTKQSQNAGKVKKNEK